MSPYQRTALASRLAALGAAGTAVWMGVRHEWLLVGVLAWGVFLLAVLGGRCQKAHLDDRARHVQARRVMRSDAALLARPIPCCSFWKNSDGKVHGPDCTRPPEARYVRDGRPLDEQEAAAFDALATPLDLPSHDARGTT